MATERVVTVPAGAGAGGYTFPNAGVTDVLDYVFDFGRWLSPLDRIGSASVVADGAVTVGAVSNDRSRVTVRLGPVEAAGTWSIACVAETVQSRVKAVAAWVTVL